MPLCLHQREKVSFSKEKKVLHFTVSAYELRGVGMLLITRESESKISIIIPLWVVQLFLLSSEVFFRFPLSFCCDSAITDVFPMFCSQLSWTFIKAKMFSWTQWEEELHLKMSLNEQIVFHWQKYRIYYNVVLILPVMRLKINYMYHMDQRHHTSYKIMTWFSI